MKAPAHILLVEDDPALAAAYRIRLEAEGFLVQPCQEGEQALGLAIDLKPDLILLDQAMSGVSGFDLLTILRHTKATANIKIIILTALAEPAGRRRAYDLGADDYMVRSHAVIGDVIHRIHHYLDHPEAGPTTETSPTPATSPAAG